MNNITKILALTTGVAAVALCGTAQAQTAVTGWGLITGLQGGWTMTDLGGGSFNVGGSAVPSGNTVWAAEFTPVTLTVGESIEVNGSFSMAGDSGALGGGLFRWGINNGSGLTTLSSGVWGGNGNATGYMWGIPTGGVGVSGSPGGEVSAHTGGAWYSGNNGYGVSTVSGGGNNNPENATANTYDFSLEYTLTSANVMTIIGSFSDTANGGVYSESGVWADNGGNGGTVATDTFSSLGFFVNGSDTPDGYNFSDITVETIAAPEPATFALFGLSGLAGAFMIRRRKA